MYIDLDFAYDEATYAIDDASKKAFAEDGFIIVRYVSMIVFVKAHKQS